MGRKRDAAAELAREAELAAELFGGPAAGEEDATAEAGAGLNDEAAERSRAGEVSRPAGPRRGKRRPAWVDEDAAGVAADVAVRKTLRKLREREDERELTGAEYEERLRRQHAKIHRAPKWADPHRKRDPEDPAGELLLRAGRLRASGASSAGRLPPGTVDATRLRDANHSEPTRAAVQSVDFHPSGQVLLAAGLDRHLRLFQPDGVHNPRLQAVFLEDCPVTQAAFCPGGSQVLCVGRRPHFYVYDVDAARIDRIPGILGRHERSYERFAVSPHASSPAHRLAAFVGDGGAVPLFSLKERVGAGELQVPGSARQVAFTSEGREALVAGVDGVVHVFDIGMRRCRARFVDEGCTRPTSLAVGPGDAWVAAGSDMGVVNVYRGADAVGAPESVRTMAAGVPLPPRAPAPTRALLQLTTAVDTLAFSPDGQMLAMASRMERDALRLVHLPSCTVFSNWPTSKSPLHYVHCAAFSPGCGFLAIGNAKGKVLLYRLHHYAAV